MKSPPNPLNSVQYGFIFTVKSSFLNCRTQLLIEPDSKDNKTTLISTEKDSVIQNNDIILFYNKKKNPNVTIKFRKLKIYEK